MNFFLNKKGKFQGWQCFAEEMCTFLSFFFSIWNGFQKNNHIHNFQVFDDIFDEIFDDIFNDIFSKKHTFSAKHFEGHVKRYHKYMCTSNSHTNTMVLHAKCFLCVNAHHISHGLFTTKIEINLVENV